MSVGITEIESAARDLASLEKNADAAFAAMESAQKSYELALRLRDAAEYRFRNMHESMLQKHRDLAQ